MYTDSIARILMFENPKNGESYFINLPIDDRPVKYFTIYKICVRLGIQIPTEAKHLKDIDDHINNIVE